MQSRLREAHCEAALGLDGSPLPDWGLGIRRSERPQGASSKGHDSLIPLPDGKRHPNPI